MATTGGDYMMYLQSMYVKVSIPKNELTKYLNLSHFLRFSENLGETPFSEHQFLDAFVLIDFGFDSALEK